MNYLINWQKNFKDVEKFNWITLRDDNIQWKALEQAIPIIKSVTTNANFDENALFDERAFVNQIVLSEKSVRPKEWEELKTENKWLRVIDLAEKSGVNLNNLLEVVEFVMCIPGSSATVERAFSLMNHIWTPDRTRLRV